MVLGVGVFAGWRLWTSTRNFVPLDVPIALRAGETLTHEFRLNLDGLYLIEITAEPTLPPETLRCLMGAQADAAKCAGLAPAIAADWTVFRSGQQIRSGNSSEAHTAPAPDDSRTVVRVIGEFPGEAGRDYRLQITTTADGSQLEPAHPRLCVVVSNLARTDFQSASVLVFSITFICVMFGAILLGIARFASRQGS